MTSPIVRTASRTGQTAVASIPRRVLSGLREMRVCFRLRCVLSHENDLLGDLPVSSLVSSDPAWPARLCTSVHMVCEHLRIQYIHEGHWFNAVAFLPQALRLGTHTLFSWQGTTLPFSHPHHKAERRQMARENNCYLYCERLVATLGLCERAIRTLCSQHNRPDRPEKEEYE